MTSNKKDASACEIYRKAFSYLRKAAIDGWMFLDRAKARIESAPGLIFHPPASSMQVLRGMESSGWIKVDEKGGLVEICKKARKNKGANKHDSCPPISFFRKMASLRKKYRQDAKTCAGLADRRAALFYLAECARRGSSELRNGEGFMLACAELESELRKRSDLYCRSKKDHR